MLRPACTAVNDAEKMIAFSHRLARAEDVAALTALVKSAIDELQRGFLSQVEIAASASVMGMDTQLIADGTYFVVESGPRIAGCGGWSRCGSTAGSRGGSTRPT